MVKNTKQRNSAIEILRIVAIFLIIFTHYIGHGTEGLITDPLNRASIDLFRLANIGVDIFVLMSGYYLINSRFHFKKLFTLVFQVVFYSWSFLIICKAFSIHEFSFKELLSAVFPTTFSSYWFFSTYVVLYVLSPFINKLLDSIQRSSHLKLIAIMGFIWIVIPTVTTSAFSGNNLTFFVMLYLIGAYMNKYPDNWFTRKNHDVKTAVFSLLFISAFVFAATFIVPSLSDHSTVLYGKNTIFIVGASVGIFSIFLKIKPFYSKIINTISGTVFGVYLIHDNPFFRDYLWKTIIDTDAHCNEKTTILHLLLSSVIVFVSGAVIELIRKNLIEKPVLVLYDKIYDKLNPKITALKEKIFKD